MKTKKTNYLNLLKYGILLLIVSLILFNCNTENQFIEQQNNYSKSTIITLKQIPQNLLSTIPEINPKIKSLQESKSGNLIIINQEQIIKMVDSLHNTNYSINFTIPNSPKNVLYNLILSTDLDNNPKKPFILKYIVHNLEDIRKEDNVLDFSLMKATIKQYSYQNFLSKTSSKTMSRSFNNPCNTFDFNGQNDSDSQLGGDGEGTLDDGNDCDVYVWSNGNTGEIFGITWSCSDGSRGNDYFGKGMDDCDTSSGGIGINGGGSGSDKPSVECPSGKYLNGECVEEEQIDSDELIGKEKCLNNGLTENGNSFIKYIFKKFEGESEFDIKISSKDKIFRKGTSVELNGKTTYLPGSSLININISTGRLSNMSSLAGIRTIQHEYIHADMFRKLNTKYSTNGDLDFKQTYNHFKNGNFKATADHETMAKLYINEMKLTLKSIHQKLIPNEVEYYKDNYPSNTLDNIYEALAWQGLKNHKVQAWLDKGIDTIKINNTIKTNLSGLTKNFCK